jgi:hypothetical protein
MGSVLGLKGGKLRVAHEPGLPAGDEGGGLALANEHAVQVLAADAKIGSGKGRSGEADQTAFGLVRSRGHFCLLRFSLAGCWILFASPLPSQATE